MKKRLDKTKLSRILDASTEHLSIRTISEEADVAQSTAWEVMKDYPLWDYYRQQNTDRRKKD